MSSMVVEASQSAAGNVPQKRCIMHLQSRDQEEVKTFAEIRWKK